MPRTQRRALVGKSLIYYWRLHLAVLLGVAVTSAVLTGALLIGDSMRGSLRDLALERLGKIDYSLSSRVFFRQALASDLEEGSKAPAAPAIVIQGSVVHAESLRRTSGVNVLGIDEGFLDFFQGSSMGSLPHFDSTSNQRIPTSAMINESLRSNLDLDVGDSILLSFGRASEINPEFILGSREATDLHRTLRLKVDKILPDRSLGRFSLEPHQTTPHNLYLPLRVLQKALEQENRANALFVSGTEPGISTSSLSEDLRALFSIEDFGLRWRTGVTAQVLESREILISEPLQDDILQAGVALGLAPQPVLTYMANQISTGERTLPYSTVSALNFGFAEVRDQLKLVSGKPSPELQNGQILLNEWAAQDLDAAVGDTITLTYYVADWDENLTSRASTFKLAGIVSMEGLAVDDTLTPRIPGVQDATDIASWDPPIPIDFSRIRSQDEEYWDDYRAAPKALLAYEDGVNLWQNRFGRATSIRFPESNQSIEKIEKALLQSLNPERIGRFRAIRQEAMDAASGSTDFGMLFVGFSFFLIISSLLLVGLLFRLGLENRVREIGLMLGLGYPTSSVRKRSLFEGIILAVLGSLAGVLLAWSYAVLLVSGLRTVWVAAIGSSFLTVHLNPATMTIGSLISLAAVATSLFLSFRSLIRLPVTALLCGTTQSEEIRPSRWARIALVSSLSVVLILLLAVLLLDAQSSPVFFFGIGTALLVAGLSLFSLWLRKDTSSTLSSQYYLSGVQLAARNCARNPGRSLLSVALVASACFVIVAVGASRSEPADDFQNLDSGAGGYALRAQSDVPLIRDLNDKNALFDLGFSKSEIEGLGQIEFFSYRLRAGEDISCRNLYRPTTPRLLGVPGRQVERGGFLFQGLLEESAKPWALLHEDLGPNVVPAFGDANSVQWILHLALGDDLFLRNENGEEIKLRLVGLFSRSVFQSELLISEENFTKHFPSGSGYSYFLIQTEPEKIEESITILEKGLTRYGFDVMPTQELLAGFLMVENTYLSTFQSLGGLGLILGTLGLGIILIRNTIERRGELAALQAFGFPWRRLSGFVLLETCFQLGLGMALGTLSALVAVTPHLLAMREVVPWASLALTLAGVFILGTLASFVSLKIALKAPLIPALRSD